MSIINPEQIQKDLAALP